MVIKYESKKVINNQNIFNNIVIFIISFLTHNISFISFHIIIL
ncbi:MAG: hypothetical protein P1U46_03415 [Patescibacteria group bacterium]|nr:hypothetical protein [Patescibacteria group bacterium]